MAFKERGYKIIERLVYELEEIGSPEDKPKFIGRKINITFKPKK